MSRIRQVDVLVEMVELGREIIGGIRHQLVYYRASVYKDETARLMGDQIDRLRVIANILKGEALAESFKDYDAMRELGAMACAPGECSFSKRVTTLLYSLDDALRLLGQSRSALEDQEPPVQDIAAEARRHRHELLALCREGSRQWAFFESL